MALRNEPMRESPDPDQRKLQMPKIARIIAWLAACATLLAATAALAFSQNALKGGGSPPGHDYMTIKAALEVLGDSRPQASGSNRPRGVRARRADVPRDYVKQLTAK